MNNTSEREKALQKVKTKGKCLKYLPSSLRQDKELIIEAIKNNVFALKYVPS